MVHRRDAGYEDSSDVFDIFETERCLSKLSIGYLGINHLINRLGNRCLRIVLEAARTRFNRIGHHEDSAFFGGRFRARVAEERLIHFLLRVRIAIGVIEIAHEGRAVVGGDEVDNHFRQVVSAGDAFAFRHVRHNDLRRIARIHLQERIIHACLVLYVVERVGHLTYIVVERTCPHEQRIRTDGLGRFGREVRHLHRVLESSRRFLREGVQQFGIDIRQFDE